VAFVIWARRTQSYYFTSRPAKCRTKATGARRRGISPSSTVGTKRTARDQYIAVSKKKFKGNIE